MKMNRDVLKELIKSRLIKTVFPVGTIHTYNGKRYQKVKDGDWKPMPDRLKEMTSQSPEQRLKTLESELKQLEKEEARGDEDPDSGHGMRDRPAQIKHKKIQMEMIQEEQKKNKVNSMHVAGTKTKEEYEEEYRKKKKEDEAKRKPEDYSPMEAKYLFEKDIVKDPDTKEDKKIKSCKTVDGENGERVKEIVFEDGSKTLRPHDFEFQKYKGDFSYGGGGMKQKVYESHNKHRRSRERAAKG